MKLLKIRIENLPLFKNGTEIDFLAEGRVREEEQHELIHLFKNFYLNRTLTFTGLNAAGKTQILNVLSFVMHLLQAKPINSFKLQFLSDRSNALNLDFEEKGKIIVYFYSNVDGKQLINKLETEILRTRDAADDEYKYFIVSEKLYRKTTTSIRAKKDLYNFEEENKKIEVIDRNSDEYLALSSDVSLLNVFYNLKEYKKMYYRDMLGYTDFNIISNIGSIPLELIQFLDPSIEFLKFDLVEERGEKGLKIELKFKGNDKVILLDSPTDLNTVLSSGTVKGLGLFMSAILTLKNGGIILIDELENHFNREIALTLIHLFTDRKINREGAILVYTTHYSELLDTLDRNDSIYIATKNKEIGLEKLSNELKRNDIKRSDQFIKGILNHTAPKYDAEMNLKRVIKKIISI